LDGLASVPVSAWARLWFGWTLLPTTRTETPSTKRGDREVTRFRALDLFSGLGGWSDGLALEGFDVTGVEIEPKIAALYRHRVIISDVCALNPLDFMGYDLIVGSPPCRDFSKLAQAGKRWKDPPNPQRGLILVKTFLDFVEKAKPTYWCMENSPYLTKHLEIKPGLVGYFAPTMRRALWGTFPAFLLPLDLNRGYISSGINRSTGNPRKSTNIFKHPNWARSWENAIIPLPVARALGAAVRQALEASP